MSSLWIEVIADVRGDNREAYDVVRATTDSTYGEFLQTSRQANQLDAAAIADILYLYGRGFHIKSVEDPAACSAERVNRSLDVLIAALLTDGAGVDGQGARALR